MTPRASHKCPAHFKAQIFQALAHPIRITIAELLSRREVSAGRIIELLEPEQANASQHLALTLTILAFDIPKDC